MADAAICSKGTVLEYRQNPPPRWAERLMAPIGRPFYVALSLGVLCVLWEGRNPESFFAKFFCVVMTIALFIYCGVRERIGHSLRRRYGLPVSPLLMSNKPWVILLLTSLLVFASLWLELPMRVAFRLSESAMRRRAEAVMKTGTPEGFSPVPGREEWVGLYHFNSVGYLRGGAVAFYLRDGHAFSNEFWTYCPDGAPTGPVGEGGPAKHVRWEGDWFRSSLEW